ncbi:MAG: HlyD family efflux transporter periplasmic adaptor subunit [Rudaea sp.]
MKFSVVACSALLLGACASGGDEAVVVERVGLAPTMLSVQGHGTLKSSKSTPLTVPGSQWAQRQLIWMVEDGSPVKEGDVIARFSAKTSELELAKALIDLQRTTLSRAAKQDELSDTLGKLQVDLSQVAELLSIAHRYANVAEIGVARNTILDAVQDENFLGIKQNTLTWRKGNSDTRGHAEMALLDAQRATNDVLAKNKRGDLAALELHAPYDGIVVLEADWSGQKPRVGANIWAGNTFANLPDTSHMEVEIAIPHSEAVGIKTDLVVQLAPLGAPEQKIESRLSWVAAAPAPRSRESPVKYLSMKAPVPVDAVSKYHWVPGQDFSATIVLLKADNALTIPNIAIENSGDVSTVSIRTRTGVEKRSVKIGARGPSRTEVLDGIRPGEDIVVGDEHSKQGNTSDAKTSDPAP